MSAARLLDLNLSSKPFVFEAERPMETAVEEACMMAVVQFMESLCDFQGVSMTNQELDNVAVSFRLRSNSFLPTLIKQARAMDTEEFEKYAANERERVKAIDRALQAKKQRDSSPARPVVGK